MDLKLKYFLSTVSAKHSFGKRRLDSVLVKCKSTLFMLSREDARRTFEMTYMSRGSVRKSGLTWGSHVVTATALFLQGKLVSADLGQSISKKVGELSVDEQVRNR